MGYSLFIMNLDTEEPIYNLSFTFSYNYKIVQNYWNVIDDWDNKTIDEVIGILERTIFDLKNDGFVAIDDKQLKADENSLLFTLENILKELNDNSYYFEDTYICQSE